MPRPCSAAHASGRLLPGGGPACSKRRGLGGAPPGRAPCPHAATGCCVHAGTGPPCPPSPSSAQLKPGSNTARDAWRCPSPRCVLVAGCLPLGPCVLRPAHILWPVPPPRAAAACSEILKEGNFEAVTTEIFGPFQAREAAAAPGVPRRPAPQGSAKRPGADMMRQRGNRFKHAQLPAGCHSRHPSPAATEEQPAQKPSPRSRPAGGHSVQRPRHSARPGGLRADGGAPDRGRQAACCEGAGG